MSTTLQPWNCRYIQINPDVSRYRYIPDVSGYILDVSGYILDISRYIRMYPDISRYIPDVSGYIRMYPGYIPDVSRYIRIHLYPDLSGYIQDSKAGGYLPQFLTDFKRET
jgi:hypothetical protein